MSYVRNNYLVWCVLNFILIVGAVAAFNLVVDPDARFLVADQPGFNLVKTGIAANSRKGKANALRQCDYDTLILGASSAETGISQKHPVMRDAKYYNAALRGGTMYEMRHIIDYALRHDDLKMVVLGLDFSTFNAGIVSLEDFADSPLAERQSVGSLAQYLFSLRTFRNSIQTLKANAYGNANLSLCADNGEHKRTYELEEARKSFDFILKTYARNQFSKYVVGDLHYTQLAEMLQELRANNVPVYAFISPTHVIQRELISEMGLGDEYEAWKRRMTQIVADDNRNYPDQAHAVLWDFSGYNVINTEPIPARDSGAFLRWYSDPVHFDQEVGNLILDRMFGRQPDAAYNVANFGVILTPENVEAVLADERRDSDSYRRETPEEIAHLQKLLQSDARIVVAGVVAPR